MYASIPSDFFPSKKAFYAMIKKAERYRYNKFGHVPLSIISVYAVDFT